MILFNFYLKIINNIQYNILKNIINNIFKIEKKIMSIYIMDLECIMSNNSFCVVKRNGEKEEVSFDKVTRRLKKLCYGLSDDVNPIIIAQKVSSQIYNNVSTVELDELAAQICISLETTHLDYGILASRIIISNNHKCTSPSFSETIYMLYNNRDIDNNICPLIAKDVYDIVMKNKDKLNAIINYEKDYLFDYFGFKTLEKAYLMKIKGKIIERIQHLFMRVSLGIHKEDLKSAINSYELMSSKYFTHATPSLYHGGTPRPQYASCFLLGMEDSVKGIYKAISDCAEISAGAGGIGLCLSKIRSKNSYIRGVNGTSNGIVPLCKVLNETARHINQAGKRPGSIAVYIEPHNVEILEFLELRKNTGAESERARDLFLALWISDLFMKRVEADADWSLFDSDECRGLDNVYGDEFETLYTKYENAGMARKVVPARKVWNYILTSQIETGTPYILYKDSINKKSNQSNIGTITNSNLCAEITIYSDTKEYAVCTLASISLPNFVSEDGSTFDFDKLIEVTNVVIRNLNKVIDVTHYPVPETELSNKKHRPLGLGVQGLADVFAKMGFAFDSLEAKELNKIIFETLYYGALVTSNNLALETAPYNTFEGSPLSKGLFQFDLWNVKPSTRYDWSSLREKIMKEGVANSLLIALMPTASTSQILGNNECFEPITSNMYTRRTIAGDFIVINKYLVKDLMKNNLWNVDMKNKIISDNGSVQNIDSIPKHIKDLYKTVWEIKQKVIIDYAVDRGPYICQTQSMNLFFEEPNHTMLTSAHFHGWKNGLKTGSYYIRTKPKAQAQQFTIDPSKSGGEACEMCSA
jgi:ribonucleoside-diphosphate reductase alpha chain